MTERTFHGRRWRGAWFVAALAGACFAGAPPTSSLAGSDPFAPFVGDWSGAGLIAGANGFREHIRCRANYSEAEGGAGLSLSIICASASFRLDVRSSVEASGRDLHGTWSEGAGGAAGQLTGKIGGGRFQGSVVGQGFTAEVSLRSDGRHQTVRITPSSSDLDTVNIELERRE